MRKVMRISAFSSGSRVFARNLSSVSRIPIYQVDAFAAKTFAGNPAAVLPLEAWLPNEMLLSIAVALPGLLLSPPSTAAGNAYSQLQGVTLTRASDAKEVELTSLWRRDLFAGVGGEKAVVCFLRHFG